MGERREGRGKDVLDRGRFAMEGLRVDAQRERLQQGRMDNKPEEFGRVSESEDSR